MVELVVVDQRVEAIRAAVPEVPDEGAVVEELGVLLEELIAQPFFECFGFAALESGGGDKGVFVEAAEGGGQELAEARKWHRRWDAGELLGRACGALGCDLRAMAQSERIDQRDKDARDLLLYFLWERGDYRGGEIGRVFRLGESPVSRRARMAKEKLEKDRKLRARFEKIKSLIKV